MTTLKKRLRLLMLTTFIITTFSITSQATSTAQTSDKNSQTDSITNDFNHYYYYQLNDIEKNIYNSLTNYKESFLNGETIAFPIHPYDPDIKLGYLYYTNIVRRSTKAFTFDNPEVTIWFENYKRDYFRSDGYTYMSLEPKTSNEANINLNSSNIRPAISNFEKTCYNFANSLTGTDEEKLIKIHNWLINRCSYDYSFSYPNIATPYGTVIEKRSVCSGFAHAYKYIADLANLKVLYVTGKFRNTNTNQFSPHAWNIVYVNSQYFLIDVTLDKTLESNDFLLSTVNDNIHYIDSNYFNYPDFK